VSAILATIAGERYGEFTTDWPRLIRSVVAARAAATETDSHTPSVVCSPRYKRASSKTNISNPAPSAAVAFALIDSQLGAGASPLGRPCSCVMSPIRILGT